MDLTEIQNKIESLERKVTELESWKAERIKQQIDFPLDKESINILGESFMSIYDIITFTNPSGIEFNSVIFKQGIKGGLVDVGFPLYRFSASTSDVLTIGVDIVNSSQGAFDDDTQVMLRTTGTLPAPLSDVTIYYVVNSTGGGTSIKLSLTQGGSAINITDTGSGSHYIQFFN